MKCANCGKEFEQPKRTAKRRYCRYTCYLAHRRKLVRTKQHPWNV
jgi:DNA-directed RNA polymerase subunit RPC12/RpoP